ncbi:NUDIX domain-containing protein [Bacillus alkalisoli]|uniref:NUDIX domain-containing protein n=1 Tax=Bacillus alkalisoli TaxID=2011008 RepID=UPI000C23D487|nr:NUDIX domain-containing protein [Bacillus alkalisoli]
MQEKKDVTMYPATAVIIFDEQKRILFRKRKEFGLWGLPTGYPLPGETIEEAAIKGVRNETGLKVELKKIIGVYSDPYSQTFEYPNGEFVQFVTTYFLGEVVDGHARPSQKEVSHVQFFGPHELPTDLMPLPPRWLVDAFANEDAAFIR